MPSREQILTQLSQIANQATTFAVAWHAVIAMGLAALVAGWRPTKRVAGSLLCIPVASVAGLAIAYGNPFNGLLFSALLVALLAAALRLERRAVSSGPRWSVHTGVAMVVFGALYPHFIQADTVLDYLYAAPVGLLPCPTLALVIGFSLMAGGLSRSWALLLSIAGFFYGIFGAARLGVHLDLVLLSGATALTLLALLPAPGGLWPGQKAARA